MEAVLYTHNQYFTDSNTEDFRYFYHLSRWTLLSLIVILSPESTSFFVLITVAWILTSLSWLRAFQQTEMHYDLGTLSYTHCFSLLYSALGHASAICTSDTEGLVEALTSQPFFFPDLHHLSLFYHHQSKSKFAYPSVRESVLNGTVILRMETY